MTRRDFYWLATSPRWLTPGTPAVIVPINQIVDTKAKLHPALLDRFNTQLWPETIRLFANCGVHLNYRVTRGEVGRPPFREPVFKGLVDRSLNVVVTDFVPLQWDNGRALNGVTTLYRGYHLCLIAINWARGNRLPYLSLNTCVHEILHALLGDIFENRPRGVMGQAREFRVDALATRMWLFREGGDVRRSAQQYVRRLQTEVVQRR